MNTAKTDFLQRNEAIDIFRALTMFIMVFVNDFWKVNDIPRWLDHIVNCLCFAFVIIGVTYLLSKCHIKLKI